MISDFCKIPQSCMHLPTSLKSDKYKTLGFPENMNHISKTLSGNIFDIHC